MSRVLAMAALAVAVGAGQGFSSCGDGTNCGSTTWNLTAGQHYDVGSVTVCNDETNIYVTYTLDWDPDDNGTVDATFGTLHLWIGNSLLNMPAAGNGAPNPGGFCSADGGACYDASGLTTYTFTMPFSDLNIVDVIAVCGMDLYVVTHAEVNADTDGDGDIDHETAFGGDNAGAGPRWWFYGLYEICCDFGDPETPFCQTAYAKGSWIWTTDKKSNPESLSSLKLTKNRWGWAINLTATGTTTYEIWAGAGLNKTSNGTHVGTLTILWDGSTVTVTYDMKVGGVDSGYCMEEVHVYAGDESPTTIAPGQYGHIAEFDPNATSYTYTTALADTNADGEVWIVAHAVTCNECE